MSNTSPLRVSNVDFNAIMTENVTVQEVYDFSENYDELVQFSHTPLTVAEVNAAAEVVGLTWPIKFTTKILDGFFGFYQCRSFAKRHIIYVNQDIPRDYACITTWHELTHARQAEYSGMNPVEWFTSLNSGEKGSNPWIADTEYEAFQESINYYLNYKDVLDPCLQ